MRRIIPSLIWFSALAWGSLVARAAAANVPSDSCPLVPATGAGAAGGPVVYLNREYGFSFFLPKSWKGFRVLACRWGGINAGNHDQKETAHLLVIRHPRYTQENPREDIPIVIFTRKQWGEDGSSLIVSAAGVGPPELGPTCKYVFASPPRFSYDELEGVREVLDIVEDTPLQPVRMVTCSHTDEHAK